MPTEKKKKKLYSIQTDCKILQQPIKSLHIKLLQIKHY